MDNDELSIVEQDRLSQLERIVHSGLGDFYAVGSALREIAEKKLYRQKYATFAEYCRGRWNIGDKYAYRIMGASEVAENLSPTGDITRENQSKIPEPITRESQLRPLTKLKPSQQKKAWSMAKKSNPIPTAKDVQAAVEEISDKKTHELTRTSSFEAAFKFMRMRGQDSLDLDFGEFTVKMFLQGNERY